MSEPWLCGAGAGEGGGVKKQQMETRRCWQSLGVWDTLKKSVYYLLFVRMCVL